MTGAPESSREQAGRASIEPTPFSLPAVLTIAGSDSSGGAGIQADLKTIAACGLYGESAICALTAQNTRGVQETLDVPPAFVRAQIESVFADIPPAAVKIGMLSSAENMHAVARTLREVGATNIVLDPVMVATSGSALMHPEALAVFIEELLPLACVVTPNVPEARALSKQEIRSDSLDDMKAAAECIAHHTSGAVLVKGGHQSFASTDILRMPDGRIVTLTAPVVKTSNTHGTGCTLSSAIACGLARGLGVEEAVREAKSYLTDCLAAGLDLGQGTGPLDHFARLRPQGQGTLLQEALNNVS